MAVACCLIGKHCHCLLPDRQSMLHDRQSMVTANCLIGKGMVTAHYSIGNAW